MIRIRYPDFSAGSRDLAGLHGSVDCDARGVTVYLLPGLTARQRKAVIRRLRQEASRGFGPALPLPGLLIALGADRLRMAAGTAAAILRLHPAVALLPGAAVVAMALFVLASTGGGLGPAPRAGLDGVLVGHGRLASVASPAIGRSGSGPALAQGGSQLGSGVPATEWQARPHHRQHHGARHHGARQPSARQREARHRGARQHHRRRGQRGCPGSRLSAGPAPAGQRAGQPAAPS